MADWQQHLNQHLVQRLQQPLNRPNMGQVLLNRTDKFLTRFSLVEQQFQRWGNFQAGYGNAVPIVFAQPVPAPLDRADSGLGVSAPDGLQVQREETPTMPFTANAGDSGSASNPSDLVIQRKLEPGATGDLQRGDGGGDRPTSASDSTNPVMETDSSPLISPTIQGRDFSLDIVDLTLVESLAPQPINQPERSPTAPNLSDAVVTPLAPADPLIQPQNRSSAEANPPETVVNVTQELFTNTELAAGDLPLVQPESPAQSQGKEIDNSPVTNFGTEQIPIPAPELTLAATNSTEPTVLPNDFGDRQPLSALPLVVAEQIQVPRIATVAAPATSLPIVKTRLEQLLQRRPLRSDLPTVQPRPVQPKLRTTPTVQPLVQSPQIATPAAAVQPLSPSTQADNRATLPLAATTTTTQERSPTAPPVPQTPTAQSPKIHAAAKPIVENFQAPPMPTPPAAQKPVDIQAIANQVERQLRRKMIIERERRGQGKWR